MSLPDYRQLKVLVADDAPPVQAFLKLMLRRQGFLDEHILQAKNGKECLRLAQAQPVDLILCDFNFGTGLNGRQILEELRHHGWINTSTVIIVITGEAKGHVVQAILDLKPDEYLLKPLNPAVLKQRIDRAFRRRHHLLPLHEAIACGDHPRALALCDELAVWHPQYLPLLRETQGKLLRKTHLYEQAKTLYQDALAQSGADWARLGLANTCLDLGEAEEALALLKPLMEGRRATIDTLDCLSRYSLSSVRIPETIAHLRAAQLLALDTSHREALISDLCYCAEDAVGMIKAYETFANKSKGTFRDNDFTRVNRIRRLLFGYEGLPQAEQTPCRQLISKLLAEVSGSEAKGPVQLAKAHFLLLTGRTREAMALILALSRSGLLSHFYDWQHLAHLLSELSFEDAFRDAAATARAQLNLSHDERVIEVRAAMLNHLEAGHRARMARLAHLNEQWRAQRQQQDHQTRLKLLLEMHQVAPYLSPVCEKLLKQLTLAWPQSMSRQDVERIARRCEQVVNALKPGQAA